jgi:hypothetical protein
MSLVQRCHSVLVYFRERLWKGGTVHIARCRKIRIDHATRCWLESVVVVGVQVVFRDPLVKLVLDRLKTLCGPYWRFLVKADNVEQVGLELGVRSRGVCRSSQAVVHQPPCPSRGICDCVCTVCVHCVCDFLC